MFVYAPLMLVHAVVLLVWRLVMLTYWALLTVIALCTLLFMLLMFAASCWFVAFWVFAPFSSPVIRPPSVVFTLVMFALSPLIFVHALVLLVCRFVMFV